MKFCRSVLPSKAHEIKERRVRVSALYKKRYKQYEIAEILGVDRTTVTRDIQAIHKEWRAQCIDNIHVVRLRELADLEEMERICIERLEKINNPWQGARWMEEQRKIKERRAKMLGLDTEQRYVVRKEISIVDKNKQDDMLLAAISSNQLPPGVTIDDIKQKLITENTEDSKNDEFSGQGEFMEELEKEIIE